MMPSLTALTQKDVPIAVVGLGYVGLPLAVALAKQFNVIGFDINPTRIEELNAGHDRTDEVDDDALQAVTIAYTDDPEQLRKAGVIIVAVPTPIDEHRTPDLRPVRGSSITVGKHMAPGTVVVYESTVYPGLTEEICVPLLEAESGLTCGQDFWIGYSPERINPGDKVHTLETIVKVVAGQDEPTADLLCELYGSIITAGVHRASSIRVAEAAKVIENTQRDLNIALMNELSILFDRMGIDTLEVLRAAGTKWNFLPFSPGLVGGHCIGVDPYYLTFKAESLGFHPQVILAGRRINDFMGKHVAETCIKKLFQQGCLSGSARVGVLGFTFKENVPDLRNTRVIDVVRELEEYAVEVLVHDPVCDAAEAEEEYGLTLCGMDELKDLDAVIVAVPHEVFKALTPDTIRGMLADPEKALLMDLRGLFDPLTWSDAGFVYWRL